MVLQLHLCKNAFRYRDASTVAGDTLIERFWGGLVFSPFGILLLSLGEVWSSPGTATAGCSPVSGLTFACTQVPNLCALWLEGVLPKCAYCFSFSSIWALSWWCRLWKYCVVLSAVLQQVLEREQYQQNWNAVSSLMQFVFCFLNKHLKYSA